jgi:RNA polymerase sigma-70 factor (ECF subfamily)
VAITPPDFESFVTAHRRPALRYATRVLRHEHDAEEALQEALVRAWSAWESLADQDAREAWFFRVLRNCCIDAGRRPVRREIPVVEVEPAGQPLLPEDVLMVGESLRRVSALLDRLPPEQRRTLLLREVGSLSYEEIARVTGAKRGTVMSRLFAARNRMAQLLAIEEPA